MPGPMLLCALSGKGLGELSTQLCWDIQAQQPQPGTQSLQYGLNT